MNSVTSINSGGIFGSFPSYKLNKPSVKMTCAVSDDSFENRGKTKKKISPSKTASVVLTAGAAGMLFARGLPAGMLQKAGNSLSKKMHAAGNSCSGFISEKIKKITAKLPVLTNFVAIKDTFCDKLLNLTSITKKFASGTRNFFKRAADSTLEKMYNKAGRFINDTVSMIKNYSIPNIKKLSKAQLNTPVKIDGKEMPLSEWLKLLEKETDNLAQIFGGSFSLGALKARDAQRNALLADTSDNVYRILFKEGGLFKASTYKSYITEKVSENAGKSLEQTIDAARKQITSAPNENSKGALENIMSILKGLSTAAAEDGKTIISSAEYKQFEKFAKRISSSIKRAAETETGSYFTKCAELKAGSAATDVMGIMLPAGAGIYAVSKSKDNDERVSASLKTCIPLAGAVAAAVYGNAKMVSGGKNLALSIASGIVLNRLGTYADKIYKNYKQSGSAVKTAAGEIKGIISNFDAADKNNKTKKPHKIKPAG